MSSPEETRKGLAVGLTGGLACGKSEVGRVLERMGVAVLDADHVAHELLGQNGPAYGPVVEHFGTEITGPGGDIDRKKLGRMVFANEKEREALNAILHPPVLRRMKAWAEKITGSGQHAAGLVPLLYEAGAEEDWDAVLCVTAPAEAVGRRLARRGLTPGEIEQRLAAQWPVEEKAKRADAVIDNRGTLDELEANTRETWNRLLEKEMK